MSNDNGKWYLRIAYTLDTLDKTITDDILTSNEADALHPWTATWPSGVKVLPQLECEIWCKLL